MERGELLEGLLAMDRPYHGTLVVKHMGPEGVEATARGMLNARALMAHAGVFFLPAPIPTEEELVAQAVRESTTRTRRYLRSMSTAVYAYNVDWNRAPLMTSERALSPDADVQGEAAAAIPPTFMVRPEAGAEAQLGVTTPIAYLTSYVADPFAPVEGLTFRYFVENKELNPESPVSWIVWSAGPDRDYDIPFGKGTGGDDSWILPYTYDPTNGVVSGGDIWRME